MLKRSTVVAPGAGLLLLTAVLVLSGCSPKLSETMVASVGSDKITLAEYERLYAKSNGGREASLQATQEEREKFLDLMTKYRLKLADAYASGLDKDPALLAEVDQYKGSLAASFLTERDVVEPGLRRLYDRRHDEIRASHILLNLSPGASSADSLAAYQRADELIALLKKGARFDSLAYEVSQDPSAKTNRGDLYYFTAGQMVAPFEDAVYAMKKGDISNTPVRTQYGLHIIKVTERKPSVGQIQAAHIMIRFDRPEPAPEDTLAALATARALQDSLRAGADFAELAKRHSGDPGSAGVGGDLGVFSRRRWIQEFDEVAFTLSAGQVSDVVRTRYGYHIIKCLAVFPPKSYEESKTDLRNQYQQTRFQDDFKIYLDNLKRTSGYAVDQKALARFVSSLDSTRSTRDSAWWTAAPADVRAATLITVGTRRYSVDSVVSLLRARPDLASTPLRAAPLSEAVGRVGEQLLFTQRADQLEKESPEFAATMQEYREGILLYQIEQERVWKKVAGSVNDSTLKGYYASTGDRYVWPNRVRFTSAQFAAEEYAKAAVARLREGATFESLTREDAARLAAPTVSSVRFSNGSATVTSAVKEATTGAVKELRGDAFVRVQLTAQPDTLAGKAKKTVALADRRLEALKNYLANAAGVPPQRVSVVKRAPAAALDRAARARANDEVIVEIVDRRPMLLGAVQTELLPVSTDERAQKADVLTPGAYSEPFAYRGATTVVRLDGREPARPKTFEEAGTEVSSAFQDYEAKRLETEWIGGLEKKYPVVKKPEELQKAFAEQPAK